MKTEEDRIRLAAKSREYYAANRDRIRQRTREYYAANRERILQKQNEAIARRGGRNQSCRSDAHRCRRAISTSKSSAKKLGYKPCLTHWSVLLSALKSQKHCCYFCGVPESECNRRLAMDHDHNTGEFRCWLCLNCNKNFTYTGLDPRDAKALKQGRIVVIRD